MINIISYMLDGLFYVITVLGLWFCYRGYKNWRNLGFVFIGVLFLIFAITHTNNLLYAKYFIQRPEEVQRTTYPIKINRPLQIPTNAAIVLIAVYFLSKKKRKEENS